MEVFLFIVCSLLGIRVGILVSQKRKLQRKVNQTDYTNTLLRNQLRDAMDDLKRHWPLKERLATLERKYTSLLGQNKRLMDTLTATSTAFSKEPLHTPDTDPEISKHTLANIKAIAGYQSNMPFDKVWQDLVKRANASGIEPRNDPANND